MNLLLLLLVEIPERRVRLRNPKRRSNLKPPLIVVPSRDASNVESNVEELKEEVQPKSSVESVEQEIADRSGNDDQLAGSEPEVAGNPVAMDVGA